jgi:hypothetical protein
MSSAWPRLDQRLQTGQQRQLLAELTRYGQARGWSPSTMVRARRSLTVLLASHPTLPHGAVDAAAARAFLVRRRLVALRVVEFLVDQGLAGVDAHAVLDGWLARRLRPLPAPIRAEVGTWVDALCGRGARAGRARQPTTVQGYLRALGPALADWSARYQPLRQVTAQDVTAQLEPVTGPTRLLVLAAMRSLFATLTARRVLFANPTAGLLGRHQVPAPALGLDPAVRAGLLGRLDHPYERLVVLLAGVHALRPAQICAMVLDAVDLTGGTLLVDGQPRRLDALTRGQLRAWLGRRRRQWPSSANPYLLVNHSTAGGVRPVKRSYVQAVFQRLGTTAQRLRVDRLLAEARASGGDPLTLARLFGLSEPTAIRYCPELGPADLGDDQRPRPSSSRTTAGRGRGSPRLSGRHAKLRPTSARTGRGGGMGEPDDEVLLVVSLPITGQWGTAEELHSRHDLEDVLDDLLDPQQLGACTGGGQGMGFQDVELAAPRARWEATWALVRSKLAELGLLGRATVEVHLDLDGGDPPRLLWPPAQDPPPP